MKKFGLLILISFIIPCLKASQPTTLLSIIINRHRKASKNNWISKCTNLLCNPTAGIRWYLQYNPWSSSLVITETTIPNSHPEKEAPISHQQPHDTHIEEENPEIITFNFHARKNNENTEEREF